jgi:hypothetical protein
MAADIIGHITTQIGEYSPPIHVDHVEPHLCQRDDSHQSQLLSKSIEDEGKRG